MPKYKMVEVEEAPYLYAERSCSMDPGDISRNMEIAFRTVGELVDRKGIASVGKALSVYPTHDDKTMSFRAGFLVSAEDARKAEGEVKTDVLPAGAVLNFIHRGPYAKLRDELLNGEIVYSLAEAKIVIESWRQHYNTRRPHASPGYRPPAPLAVSWPASPSGPASPAIPTVAARPVMHQD